MLNDHLSILDSSDTSQSNRFNNYGEEDPEDGEDVDSFYNTKSSMNTSGIRIKVRKSSVDPNSKKKSWASKYQTGPTHSTKYGMSMLAKPNTGPIKPNKDIEIETEDVRGGSPLNYVRDKKRKTLEGKSKDGDEESSKKNNLIVMQKI
jgi:hypothetical protein